MQRFRFSAAILACLLGICAPASAQTGAAPSDTAEAAAWQSIKNSSSAADWKSFLARYPKGAYAREAREKYSAVSNAMLPAEVQSIDVQFPQEVRRMGRAVGPTRTVTLGIEVHADGSVGDVDIAQSSGFDLYDKRAQSAARDATYLPAMNRGKPVDSHLNYDVSFGLLCNRAAGNHSCDNRTYPTTCSATVCDTLLR